MFNVLPVGTKILLAGSTDMGPINIEFIFGPITTLLDIVLGFENTPYTVSSPGLDRKSVV
jgi:hypothetical protein